VERAEQLARTIRETPLITPGGQAVTLTVSFGVAHAPDNACDLPGLYLAADRALYAAKHAGRDRVATLSNALMPADVIARSVSEQRVPLAG
jgi:diguanylate cyclase (GGDEF)-like protein